MANSISISGYAPARRPTCSGSQKVPSPSATAIRTLPDSKAFSPPTRCAMAWTDPSMSRTRPRIWRPASVIA